MNIQTRQLQKMLQELYKRQKGHVGFIDESYRLNREGEFPFYTVTATVIHVEDLDDFRDDYSKVVGGDYWHTTNMNKNGKRAEIREFIDVLAKHESELVVSVQIEIEDGDLEHARRECLIQAVKKLENMGCNLVVYERREDRKTRNADEALFSRAKRDGFLPKNIKVFPGSPSVEKLLWGPDLAGWAMRRYIAVNEVEWVKPIINNYEVIDASPGKSLKEKRPQPAAAKGSGPESSLGPEGEGKNRSSFKSMSQTDGAEKTIFEIFPNVSDPIHDPVLLREWLKAEFPE